MCRLWFLVVWGGCCAGIFDALCLRFSSVVVSSFIYEFGLDAADVCLHMWTDNGRFGQGLRLVSLLEVLWTLCVTLDVVGWCCICYGFGLYV